jgi:hypothetical protein
VLRIYCKSLVARLYEKFSPFLHLEICVNRLKDLGLNKRLENLRALREKLVPATDRLAGLEAELLNVHVDFPYFSDWPFPFSWATVSPRLEACSRRADLSADS